MRIPPLSSFVPAFALVGSDSYNGENGQLVIQNPAAASNASFPGHVLYTLNDGNKIPSPAYGVGSVLKGFNVTADVLMAFKSGYRHIDNSAIYKNEEYVGDAIESSKIPRDELFITTKFDAMQGQNVTSNIEESLRKLKVSYVDLYLIHFPFFVEDIKSIWTQFESLVDLGLTKSIGISNYNASQTSEILSFARIKPALNQIKYHAYNAEIQQPILDVSKAHGIQIAAYSSLTPITTLPGGKAETVAEELAENLSERAGGVAVTPGQAILDWVKGKGIVAVTTSSKAYRQIEQLQVFSPEFPALTVAEIKQLETADPGWKQNEGNGWPWIL